MRTPKQNKVIILTTQNKTHPPKSKKDVSKKTHPLTLRNLLVKTTGQNSNDVDLICSLISQLRSSYNKLGFIPLTDNINKQYNLLVEECQKANSIEMTKYQPLFSHCPNKEEVNDLFWGLDRIITYRINSELGPNEFINNPFIVMLDTNLLIKNQRMNVIFQNLLDSGPKVGIYFLLTSSETAENHFQLPLFSS